MNASLVSKPNQFLVLHKKFYVQAHLNKQLMRQAFGD